MAADQRSVSVSTICSSEYIFDQEEQAERYAALRGLDVDDVLETWRLSAEFGGAIHGIIEEIVQSYFENPDQDFHLLVTVKSGCIDAENYRIDQDHVVYCLTNSIAFLNTMNKPRLISIEAPLSYELEIEEGKVLTIKARLDLVLEIAKRPSKKSPTTRRMLIVDWKTGRKRGSDERTVLQLSLYSWLYHKVFRVPLDQICCTAVYIGDYNTPVKHKIFTPKITDKRVHKLLKKLEQCSS